MMNLTILVGLWCLTPLSTIFLLHRGSQLCTRLAAASDKVYQLLAHGRWFSPGTPAFSTTKTGRHDIAEILLKVTSKHIIYQVIRMFLQYR
jgi:hypothetical protein